MPQALTDPPARRFLLTREVAAILGVSIYTVRELVRTGRLRPLPFSRGRWLRFALEDVERLLDTKRPESQTSAPASGRP